MGFKIKKKNTFSLGSANQKRNLMTRIAKMLDANEIIEAYPLLEDAVKKYPGEERFWEMLAFVGSEIQNPVIVQRAMAKLINFQPKEADNWFNLALTYGMLGHPALSMKTFSEFVRRFPDDYRKNSALEIIEKAESDIEGFFEAYDLPNNKEGLELAVMHDKIQLFMHQNEYEKSIETANELIKKAPEFISPYNNLSLVYFMKGDVEKAVESAKIALEKQPENFHALGNTVRFLAFLGKKDEAQNYANKLRVVESSFADSYVKKVEAFAFLGDDEAVAEVYKEIEKKEIKIDNEGYCKSLAAFSFYRLGDEEKAEELWEDAADDEFEIAEENLEELELPVYERDVFALPMNYWLPSAYLNKLLEASKGVMDSDAFDEDLKKKLSEFFNENPNIIKVFPMILERADFMGKEFIIKIAEWSEHPQCLEVLKDFALGKNGSDEIRNHAAMVLSKLKAIPKKVRLWIKGEWLEILLLDYFITEESGEYEQYPIEPEARKIFEKAFFEHREGKLELAEQSYKKALEIQPDNPVLLNNFLALKQDLDKDFDFKKEVKSMHKRFPDYFFAAMSAANVELVEGNVDEAESIAEKFSEKDEWHTSEFKVWMRYKIELCLVREQYDAARSWLEMMKNGSINFDDEKDEAEYKKLEERINNTEMYKKLSSGFSKLLGKNKKNKKTKGKSKK